MDFQIAVETNHRPEMDTERMGLCNTENRVICKNGSGAMGLDQSGNLYHCLQGRYTLYDFNGCYSGYYPSCKFTALGAGGGLFYAAGVDRSGAPHLFSSLSGSVWEERSLTAWNPFGGQKQAKGQIVSVLYMESARQILLVTDAGQVVTLPDCPKCVRIQEVGGRPICARLKGNQLEILMADGNCQKMYLDLFLQYRVSWSYAAELIRTGGRVIDLRTPDEFISGTWRGSENVPYETLANWLPGQEQDAVLLFLCRLGLLADNAAEYARRKGWKNAYSMGGLSAIGHLE